MRRDACVLLSGMEQHCGWRLQQEVRLHSSSVAAVPLQPTEFSGIGRHELEPQTEALRVHVQRGRSCSIRFLRGDRWQFACESIINSTYTGLVYNAARPHWHALAHWHSLRVVLLCQVGRAIRRRVTGLRRGA